MYELMQLQHNDRVGLTSTMWYDTFVDCVTNSYINGTKFEGAAVLQQSDRVIDTMMYQWESGAGALLSPDIALLSYYLLRIGRISDEEAAEMLTTHFECEDTSEANRLLLEHLEPYEFGEDDEYETKSDLEQLIDVEHVGWYLSGDMMMEFQSALNEFANIVDRALRLTYTGYDQQGADGQFNHTEWIATKDLIDLSGVKDTEPFKTKFDDYDMHLFRVNPMRGGGFSCTN